MWRAAPRGMIGGSGFVIQAGKRSGSCSQKRSYSSRSGCQQGPPRLESAPRRLASLGTRSARIAANRLVVRSNETHTVAALRTVRQRIAPDQHTFFQTRFVAGRLTDAMQGTDRPSKRATTGLPALTTHVPRFMVCDRRLQTPDCWASESAQAIVRNAASSMFF